MEKLKREIHIVLAILTVSLKFFFTEVKTFLTFGVNYLVAFLTNPIAHSQRFE